MYVLSYGIHLGLNTELSEKNMKGDNPGIFQHNLDYIISVLSEEKIIEPVLVKISLHINCIFSETICTTHYAIGNP